MSVKKQPDPDTGEISDSVDEWFRQFLKHLELHLVETGQRISSESGPTDYHLAAMQAVKMTLLESGINDDDIRDLFGRVVMESRSSSQPVQWNSKMNRRRFELIDGDIQGTLTPTEQIELAGLTQLMREHVDAEEFLPFQGARELHRRLKEITSDSAGPDQ